MCYQKLNAVTCSWENPDYQKMVFDIENTIKNSESKNVLYAHSFSGYAGRYAQGIKNNFLIELKEQLIYFADKFKNKDFYILEQNYQVPNLMQCFYNKKFNYIPNKFIQSLRHDGNNCSELDNYRIKQDQREKFTQKVNDLMDQVSKERDNLHFIKMRDITCDQNGCKLFDKNNRPIFSDTGHLSIWGRNLIAPILLERIGVKM